MTRTFIFDSADPNNSNFLDDGGVAIRASEAEMDEDFLSFEDDLHTDNSTTSTDDSSSSSNRSGLTRFRSRTSSYRSNSNDSRRSRSSSSSSDGGRSQRFARAFSRAVSSGASVVNRHIAGPSSSGNKRHGSVASISDMHITGDSSDRKRKKKSRRRRSRHSDTRSAIQVTLEDVNEDDNIDPVRIINHQAEIDTIPFPGVLNGPNTASESVSPGKALPNNGVAFHDDVKINSEDEAIMIQNPVPSDIPQFQSGMRQRRTSTHALDENATTKDQATSTGLFSNISDKPIKPQRASSQKRSRRRYSGSMGSATAAQRRAGWEPGVDVRTTDIILQSVGSVVTIVDYSVTRYRIIQTEVYPAPKTDDSEINPSLIVNKEFHEHLNSRPSWSQVRWISVNGLSWEAISAISERYQLHRLAIEDMVDIPQRTKVDLYPTHTFCCLPLHKLISFKPPSKQDFNFFDWALGREKSKSAKKKSSSNTNGTSKLQPTKSNASAHSDKSKEKSSSTSSSNNNPVITDVSLPKNLNINTFTLPQQPPNITIPADSGRRRPINGPMPVPKKLPLPNGSSSSSSSSSDDDDDEENHKPLNSILAAKSMETIYDWNNPYSALQQKNAYIESKRPLAAYKRAIGVEQVSLFLTSQSTVISFFERSATDIERPLLARLSTQSTILRESCDPSLLLQAIVDAIVDLLQPIIAAYRRRMDELEIDAMMNPSMSHTQDLHLMAGELSMLRNTIVPITSLVLSLRDHTGQTPTSENGGNAANNNNDGTGNGTHNAHNTSPQTHSKIPIISKGTTGISIDPSVVPVSSSTDGMVGSKISALAKVYLADISDHLLSHTQDLDVMRNNVKNMIDLIFNTISIQSSDSVKQLSLVTVIFLPLSFWTGYFGMNFTEFRDLDHTPKYYWTIAIPFCIGVVILAMLAWIRTAFLRSKTFMKKRIRMHQRRIKKELRKKAKKREISNV